MWYSLQPALAILQLIFPATSSVPSLLDTDSNQQRVLQYEFRHPEPQSTRVHHCTLRALGGDQDDSDNLVKAVGQCGTDGVITLPDPL